MTSVPALVWTPLDWTGLWVPTGVTALPAYLGPAQLLGSSWQAFGVLSQGSCCLPQIVREGGGRERGLAL